MTATRAATFFDCSTTHTNSDVQAWWEVDLGGTYSIQQIDVWNRTDCCAERLSDFHIFVSDEPFLSTSLTDTVAQTGVADFYVPGQAAVPTSVSVNRRGRYVRLQLTSQAMDLSLAEVQVWASSSLQAEQADADSTTSTARHSLSLNGSGAYIEIPDNASLNLTGALTVEAWIKPSGPSGQQGIIERYNSNTEEGGYGLRLDANGRLYFFIAERVNELYDSVTSAEIVSAGIWHHVAGVSDGTELRLYLDGKLAAAKATVRSPGTSSANLVIGARGDDRAYAFNGLIDEARVTSEAIYKADFIAAYELTGSVVTENVDAGVRGLWKFDGQNFSDRTGGNEDGSTSGAVAFSTDVPAYDKSARMEIIAQAGTLPRQYVGFDVYPNGSRVWKGDIITNQYPYVRFSAASNSVPVADYARDQGGGIRVYSGQSPFNYLTTNSSYYGIYHYGERTMTFTEPADNVSFMLVGMDDLTTYYNPYPVALLDVYQYGEYARTYSVLGCGNDCTVSIDFGSTNINGITQIRIHSIRDSAGIGIDNLFFTPHPLETCVSSSGEYPYGTAPPPVTCKPGTYNAEGALDVIGNNGMATGLAFDRDVPNTPVMVELYVDGTTAAHKIGTTLANLPRAGVPVAGNHGFSFQIPEKFKDGKPHTLYAVAFDKTGNGNAGFTRTFNIASLQSISFTRIDNSFAPLDANPAAMGGGLRIFPDDLTPTDTVNRARVRVTATGAPNTTLYFRSFDPDAPSDVTVGVGVDPNDANRVPTGDDNKAMPGMRGAIPRNGILSATSKLADATGVASVELTVSKFAGNNYLVAASTDQAYLNSLRVKGTSLTEASGAAVDATKVKLSPQLFVWRRLHLEVDSMGVVSGNVVTGTVTNAQPNQYHNYPEGQCPGTQTKRGCFDFTTHEITVSTSLEPYRYGLGTYDQNGNLRVEGAIEIDGTRYAVRYALNNTLSISTPNGVTPRVGAPFALYDDDDYDTNLDLKADEGQDVNALEATLSLMQTSDDLTKNVFAATYITPSYSYAASKNYNNSNLSFVLNVDDGESENLIIRNCNSLRDETNDFWIVYVLLAYQFTNGTDFDPLNDSATAGITLEYPTARFIDSVSNYSQVPRGSIGSLIFLETMRDYEITRGYERRKKSLPHEVGHQFGLLGHKPELGVMGYSSDSFLVPSHINAIRWRINSPDKPR